MKQHACAKANEIVENSSKDIDTLKVLYELAESLNEVYCPTCWIENKKSIALTVMAHANSADFYECESCGFSGAFPKYEH